jgi:hypothetical protein
VRTIDDTRADGADGESGRDAHPDPAMVVMVVMTAVSLASIGRRRHGKCRHRDSDSRQSHNSGLSNAEHRGRSFEGGNQSQSAPSTRLDFVLPMNGRSCAPDNATRVEKRSALTGTTGL